jgi:hypothetical protein
MMARFWNPAGGTALLSHIAEIELHSCRVCLLFYSPGSLDGPATRGHSVDLSTPTSTHCDDKATAEPVVARDYRGRPSPSSPLTRRIAMETTDRHYGHLSVLLSPRVNGFIGYSVILLPACNRAGTKIGTVCLSPLGTCISTVLITFVDRYVVTVWISFGGRCAAVVCVSSVDSAAAVRLDLDFRTLINYELELPCMI